MISTIKYVFNFYEQILGPFSHLITHIATTVSYEVNQRNFRNPYVNGHIHPHSSTEGVLCTMSNVLKVFFLFHLSAHHAQWVIAVVKIQGAP